MIAINIRAFALSANAVCTVKHVRMGVGSVADPLKAYRKPRSCRSFLPQLVCLAVFCVLVIAFQIDGPRIFKAVEWHAARREQN